MKVCTFCGSEVEHPVRLTTLGPEPFMEHELAVSCFESDCIIQLGQVSGIAMLAARLPEQREALAERRRRIAARLRAALEQIENTGAVGLAVELLAELERER